MSYYKKGQLIWAKIKGYPWWPGVVAKANSDKYGNLDKEVVVNFIGENSHAVLTQDKVADFVEKRKQYSLNKNKKLQESIQIAEKILEGSLTYEQERSRLEDLEDSSSHANGSEDSSDEGGDQEKEVNSSRSSSSKKSKSDSVSISEAVWKDTESLLGTKSAKKSQDSDDSGDKNSDSSSDDSRSITSDRPSKDKQKAKKLEEKKAKQEKRKAAENKLKKKKSLEQQRGKVSKSNSLQPESTRGKTASVDKNKPSKNPKEPTPLKSRKIKGKLLIDEDGETENFWKSPQKFSREAQAAEENNSESPVRKKKGKKLNIDSMSEISQTDNNKSMGTIPPSSKTGIEVEEDTSRKEMPTANVPNEPPLQKEELDDIPEQEEEGVKKKLKLENSFVEVSKVEDEEEEEEKPKKEKTIDRARETILRRFEKDLEELLRQISTKVKASIKLDDRDSDILKLLQTMEEFESKEIQGSELVDTKIGKIFKTIHFVLIRHKSHLPDNCDIIITTLAKILHIIKNKIMKYSMDNSEYLQLLKIIPENEKIEPSLINLLDINFEKIRMKVEENISNQPALPLAKPDAKGSLYASLDTETLLQPPPSLLTDIQNIPQSIIKEDLIEEEHQIEDNMTSIPLRKKVCKKLAKVLQKCYLLEKNNAQELTIQIEDKLNRLNNGKENEYKQTIKVLHKLMKARRLKLDELNKFSSLDEIFKSKIQANQRDEFTKKT